jgi:hypothetical protein
MLKISERERAYVCESEKMFTELAFFEPCRLGKIQSTYIRAHKIFY